MMFQFLQYLIGSYYEKYALRIQEIRLSRPLYSKYLQEYREYVLERRGMFPGEQLVVVVENDKMVHTFHGIPIVYTNNTSNAVEVIECPITTVTSSQNTN